ncbi:MAG TPA: mechanosensitive ion channel [Candidatus Fimousia stercorigallinarum]|nr:mechanosensitive ion channel [Candidatus Fimousia stercorigallinarum]
MENYKISEKFIEKVLDNAFSTVSDFGIKLIWALIILSVGFKISKYLVKWTKKFLERSSIDDSVASFMMSIVRIGSKVIVIMMAVTTLGIETSSILAVLASAGVAVGLALQGSLSNICSGLLILLVRPFKVGDVIKEDTHGNEGTVVAVDLIYTRIKTVDNKVIVIPNSVITSSSLTNVTGQSERRLEIRFGIGYQDDIKLAKAIIERIAAEHAKTIDQNPIQVYVDELADSCIYIGMRVWVPTDDYYPIRWDILERVKIEFDKAGINIPYNQLDVHLVKDGE